MALLIMTTPERSSAPLAYIPISPDSKESLRNHERLKEAQAIAHVGNWELNFATGKAVWSDEACRIYGISPKDNLQSFESWFSFIHPEDVEFVKKEISRSEITFSEASFKHRIVWKDGTVRHIHSIAKFE